MTGWTVQTPPFKVRCLQAPWVDPTATPPKVTVDQVYDVFKSAIGPDGIVWFQLRADDNRMRNYNAVHFVRVLASELTDHSAGPEPDAIVYA